MKREARVPANQFWISGEAAMPISPEIERAIADRHDEFLNTLFRLLRQPSISTQGIGVDECAELVKTILGEHGIPGRVIGTAGLPVVYGERLVGPDANTILIYGTKWKRSRLAPRSLPPMQSRMCKALKSVLTARSHGW